MEANLLFKQKIAKVILRNFKRKVRGLEQSNIPRRKTDHDKPLIQTANGQTRSEKKPGNIGDANKKTPKNKSKAAEREDSEEARRANETLKRLKIVVREQIKEIQRHKKMVSNLKSEQIEMKGFRERLEEKDSIINTLYNEGKHHLVELQKAEGRIREQQELSEKLYHSRKEVVTDNKSLQRQISALKIEIHDLKIVLVAKQRAGGAFKEKEHEFEATLRKSKRSLKNAKNLLNGKEIQISELEKSFVSQKKLYSNEKRAISARIDNLEKILKISEKKFTAEEKKSKSLTKKVVELETKLENTPKPSKTLELIRNQILENSKCKLRQKSSDGKPNSTVSNICGVSELKNLDTRLESVKIFKKRIENLSETGSDLYRNYRSFLLSVPSLEEIMNEMLEEEAMNDILNKTKAIQTVKANGLKNGGRSLKERLIFIGKRNAELQSELEKTILELKKIDENFVKSLDESHTNILEKELGIVKCALKKKDQEIGKLKEESAEKERIFKTQITDLFRRLNNQNK